jgi:hypothetical protein
VHLTQLPPTLPEHQFQQNEHIFGSHQPTVSVEGIASLHIVPSISISVDSPENEFRYSTTRATSHPFAHTKSAIRWLQWLLRNLSNTIGMNYTMKTEKYRFSTVCSFTAYQRPSRASWV